MKTVLFFVSATRHSCRKRLNGAFRFFKGDGLWDGLHMCTALHDVM